MIRINLKYGEARVSDDCPQSIVDMLENISEFAFNDHLERRSYYFFSDGSYVTDRDKAMYPIVYSCITYSEEKANRMFRERHLDKMK